METRRGHCATVVLGHLLAVHELTLAAVEDSGRFTQVAHLSMIGWGTLPAVVVVLSLSVVALTSAVVLSLHVSLHGSSHLHVAHLVGSRNSLVLQIVKPRSTAYINILVDHACWVLPHLLHRPF